MNCDTQTTSEKENESEMKSIPKKNLLVGASNVENLDVMILYAMHESELYCGHIVRV